MKKSIDLNHDWNQWFKSHWFKSANPETSTRIPSIIHCTIYSGNTNDMWGYNEYTETLANQRRAFADTDQSVVSTYRHWLIIDGDQSAAACLSKNVVKFEENQ